MKQPWPTFHFHPRQPSSAPGVHEICVRFAPDGTINVGRATDNPEALAARVLWLADLFVNHEGLAEECAGQQGAADEFFAQHQPPAA